MSSQSELVGSLDGLTASLDGLLAETKSLRTDVQNAETARRRLTRVVVGLMTVGTLSMIAVLILVISGLNVSNDTQNLADTIFCYTTPGEPCYERQQESTQMFRELILDSQIASAECVGANDVRACVLDRLAESGG